MKPTKKKPAKRKTADVDRFRGQLNRFESILDNDPSLADDLLHDRVDRLVLGNIVDGKGDSRRIQGLHEFIRTRDPNKLSFPSRSKSNAFLYWSRKSNTIMRGNVSLCLIPCLIFVKIDSVISGIILNRSKKSW